MALTAIVQVGLEPTQLPVGSNGTTVFNSSNQSIWVSDEATVTPTTGVQIPAASSIIFPSGPLYAITTGAVCKVEIILAPTPFTPSAVTVTGSADVNVQNTPAVTVESGTIDVGTLPDVTIANATLNVSGTVDVGTLPDVNLASGTTVDATITNATLNVTGSTVDLASGTTIDLASGTSVDANITNATLTVETSGTTDVNVTNATLDASISGPVTIETASGTPIDANVSGSLTSITDPVSVTGPVTVEGVSGGTTIGVAGTVDANITNATLTVETSGTTDVNVTNATVPVSGSITASIDGPVAVSSGTIYIVNPFTGESLPSPTTSTTTGNATLSSTDYNLVSWTAVPLPAGSPGNLVYDSNLENAIAAVGPTWDTSGVSIGTANGDYNVRNAGTDSAEWVYYGTGAPGPNVGAPASATLSVVPGATYTLSAYFDSTACTGGAGLQLATSIGGAFNAPLGTQGVYSHTFHMPDNVTSLNVYVNINGSTVTAGAPVSWSQIQLTETSTVQPYAPGPLWEYPVYGRGGYLGETTALAFEDTGGAVDTSRQPPTINSTYPQLEAPTPTVTVEGTAGSTTYDYQVTVKTDNASAGATRLAPSPGTNIGTMDIASGAKVELAAGSAQIGTVDLASGASVDANITNATLTVETSGTIDTNVTNSSLTVDASGSTIELASGTSVALDASTATIGTVELASGSSVDANITNATLDITGSSVNVSGGQLKTSGGLGLQPTSEQLNPAWLGDGSDGDVTISGTVTLTRDMLYSSLTVPSGAVVATAGFRIRCTGTITLDGSITNNGTDGAVSGGGLGAPAGTLPGGGNGGFTNNSGSGTAAAGFQSGLCLYGGGLGQSVLAINGATAAQGGGNGSDTPTPTIFPTISQMVSGAIGGGGGGAAYSNVSDEVSNGGGGGGPILILCNEFTGSGALASIGGSGYCESTGAAGGGGSGNVIVVCFTQSFTGNINVLGGTGVQSADYLGPAAGNGIGFILDGIEW